MTDSSIDLPDTPAGREIELRARYREIVGAQSVCRQGEIVPLRRLRAELECPERRRRERAWRLAVGRRLEDAPALSELWRSLGSIRCETASHAGAGAHATPLDAGPRAQLAVEEFVTSVLVRLHERRRRQLGLRTIRPWDLFAPPPGFPLDPLFASRREAIESITRALRGVQDQAVTVLCTPEAPSASLESDEDVEELLAHYGAAVGHATILDPRGVRREVADVARVALPQLVLHGAGVAKDDTRAPTSLKRARIRHLERRLLGWTFGAMIDAFEEWAHAHPGQVTDEDAAAGIWSSLWLRFLPAVDWSGLEDMLKVEWQTHDALFLRPGESLIRISHELQVFKTWSQATDCRTWFLSLGMTGGTEDHRPPRAAIIVEQDLLDVARWMEDAIEDLESEG